MNWGNKLILVFVAFGGMMSFMVYRCMKMPVNLVSKSYYVDEIAYQQVIDSRDNTRGLDGKVKVLEEKEFICISLPVDMKDKKIAGSIVLYCPVNARFDRQFALQTDSVAYQAVGKESLVPGNYVVKISWTADGKSYYDEQPLTIH
jgi:hypothetical protein